MKNNLTVVAETKCRVIEAQSVSGDLCSRMHAIHARYFQNSDRCRFEADLMNKDWVLLLNNELGDLIGFTTAYIASISWNGKPVRYLFSGDTIVEREYWQLNALIPSFGVFMMKIYEQEPNIPLFWFLISKGHRTYRILPTYFKLYVPSVGDTNKELSSLLQYIASDTFGSDFYSDKGIIRFAEKKDYLIPALLKVDEERKKNRHVAFFLEKNPGYVRGDELACIAPIAPDNLTAMAHRVLRSAHSFVEFTGELADVR